MKNAYYINPPLEVYLTAEKKREVASTYLIQSGGVTYTQHNYLIPGIMSNIKKRHFEMALKVTRDYFHTCNVIDFGCADGAFIPSLAHYFNHVVAIDNELDHIKVCSRLVNTKQLDNVQLICNNTLTIDDIRLKVSDKKYHILYLLETLEHIGDRKQLYRSKIKFLKELASLLDNKGVIIISVPNMVGLYYLIQRLLSHPFGTEENRRSIDLKNLFLSCFLKDTSDLEKQWLGGHVGFNHEKLERHLRNDFQIVKKVNMVCQMEYIIQKN